MDKKTGDPLQAQLDRIREILDTDEYRDPESKIGAIKVCAAAGEAIIFEDEQD